MTKNVFKDFFNNLKRSGQSSKFEIVSEEEINDFVSNLVPQILPQAYIDFMHYAGHGQYWMGSDYSFECVKYLKEYAKELLIENEFSYQLQDDDFVFWMHQGYIFCFFNLNEGDNPPVYFYDEGKDMIEFEKCSSYFTDAVMGNSYPLGLLL